MPGNNEFKYSISSTTKWANYIISNKTSLKEASIHFKIPVSTMWRYLKTFLTNEEQKKLMVILTQNKKDSPHKAISKKWENYYSQSK